ncbi:MAG: hypothetical protein ACLP7F_23310 [Acidimicrobiales bacterium]
MSIAGTEAPLSGRRRTTAFTLAIHVPARFRPRPSPRSPGPASPWPGSGPRGASRSAGALRTVGALGTSGAIWVFGPVGAVGRTTSLGPVWPLWAVLTFGSIRTRLMARAVAGGARDRGARASAIAVAIYPRAVGAGEGAPGAAIGGPTWLAARGPGGTPALSTSIGAAVKAAASPIARQLRSDGGHRRRFD